MVGELLWTPLSDDQRRKLHARFPYYARVPREPVEHYKWRQRAFMLGFEKESAREDLWKACARDCLFFVNTFLWLHEPRDGKTPVFNTYEFQDWAFLAIDDAVREKRDVVIAKSRDMGASWLCLAYMFWRWCFRSYEKFHMGSMKLERVDKPGDTAALFQKVDHLLAWLPGWLRPHEHDRTFCRLTNGAQRNEWTGESNNPEFARAGRYTMLLHDEFASGEFQPAMLAAARDAAATRVFNSTYKGIGNSFYDLTRKTSMVQVRMHWINHPSKALNARRRPDGKWTSPWYEKELDRMANAIEAAQELDMDPAQSSFKFFNIAKIEELQEQSVEPLMKGYLEYDEITGKPHGFVEDGKGPIALWFRLEEDGRPPALDWAGGIDTSAGSISFENREGASNSVFSGGDQRTGQKLLEMAIAGMTPERWAPLCAALGRWLGSSVSEDHEANLIWDGSGGPGTAFSKRMLDLDYRRFWLKKQNEISTAQRRTATPGFHINSNSALVVLLTEYRHSVTTGRFVNPSRLALRECVFYEHLNEKVVHVMAQNEIDPTGAKRNHGDRVIADALLNHVCEENREVEVPIEKREPAIGSPAWAMQQRQDEGLRSRYVKQPKVVVI